MIRGGGQWGAGAHFFFLSRGAGPELTWLLPAHRRFPDQTTPHPHPPVSALGGGAAANASWLTSSLRRLPCLASRLHTEELGIGTV